VMERGISSFPSAPGGGSRFGPHPWGRRAGRRGDVPPALKATGRCLALAVRLLFLVLILPFTAEARTDIFFLAPVTGSVSEEVAVPVNVKGERLQAGSFDMLVDSRYCEPVATLDNRVKMTEGPLAQANPTYFFMAAVQETLYDEGRPYLRTVRVAFAFQSLINTKGVETLARIHLRLVSRPPEGLVLLPILRDGARMAEFAGYRQGGGVVFFSSGGQAPDIAILEPVNGGRYEETEIEMEASATDASGQALAGPFWVNPFAIVEPMDTSPVLFTGLDGSLTFTPGIHALYCVGLDSAGNGNGAWTVFGVQEDVVVVILGAVEAHVVETVTGVPVSGAVVLLSQNGLIMATCFTDTDGACLFEGVDEGAYHVDASKENYEGDSTEVVVPRDETVGVQLRVLALVTPSGEFYEYGTLDICVREGSSSGPLVSGAEVREMRGTYACSTDLSGCCRVVRVRQGLDLRWIAYTEDLFSEISLPVRLDGAESDLVLVVNPVSGTGVRLAARDTFSMDPVPDLQIQVGSGGEAVLSRTTDAAGSALLTPLAPGQAYTVAVRTVQTPGPDGTTWQAGQDLTVDSRSLSAGMLLPITLPFLGHFASLSPFSSATSDPGAPATVAFTVTDLMENPLSGCAVTVRQGALTVSNMITEGTGTAILTGLWPGTYEVSVLRRDYQGVEFEVTAGGGQSLRRFVQLAPVMAPQVRTEAKPGQDGTEGGDGVCPAVRITVLDPYSGAPIAGVRGDVFQLIDGAVVRTGTTDSSGILVASGLAGLSPLGIRLTRQAGTGSTIWSELREMGPLALLDDQVSAYTLYLSPGATSVTVEPGEGDSPVLVAAEMVLQDGTGSPIGETEFQVECIADGTIFDLETDISGRAIFLHDIPGDYVVTAMPEGFQGIRLPITLGLAGRPTVTFTLPRIPTILRPSYTPCSGSDAESGLTASLQVAAFNAYTGGPLSGVAVEVLEGQSGAEAALGVTDSQGIWTHDGLTPGTFSIRLSRLHQRGWTEVQFIEGAALQAGYQTEIRAFILPEATDVAETAPPGGEGAESSASIALKVLDTSGRPLSNVQISLMDGQGRVVSRSFTDTAGLSATGNLNPGTYSLELTCAGRLGMWVTEISLWPGKTYSWLAVLPAVSAPILGSLEGAPSGAQLRALVVDGRNFQALSFVQGTLEDPWGAYMEDIPAARSDQFGRLTVDGLQDSGPVFLTLSASTYRARREGPIHLEGGKVLYALYALTPESLLTSISNPDRLPAGKVHFLPAIGHGLVQDQDTLTVFSFDPVRLELRRLTRSRLPGSTSRVLAAGLAPLTAAGDFPDDIPYLILIQTGSGTLKVYTYEPALGMAVNEVATLHCAGEIQDCVLIYNGLAVASSAGVFLYRLTNSSGTLAPALASHLALPAIRLLPSGSGLYCITQEGGIVGMDIGVLEMPLISGTGPLEVLAEQATCAWPQAALVDATDTLRSMQFLRAQPFGKASDSSSHSTPEVHLSGMGLTLAERPAGIRAMAVGSRSYVLAVSDNTLNTVELTDNVPLLVSSLPIPGPLHDVVLARYRTDSRWSSGVLAASEAGYFGVPLHAPGKDTVHVVMDFTPYLPDLDQSYRVWTAQGFTDVLTTQIDADGARRFLWETDLPAGVYDFAVVDLDGRAVVTAYNISLYQDIQAEVYRMNPTLSLLQADRRLSGTFTPGSDVWMRVGLDVWNPPLCDVYLLLDYRFNTDFSTGHWSFVPDLDGSLELVSWGGTPEGPGPTAPTFSSWPARPLSNADVPVFSLPAGTGYAGGGSLSLVFTTPGGHPAREADIYGSAVTRFRIED